MGKRGDSQLDWIISMALFLLYIGWFFMFINPNISFGTNKNSLMILLKDNFNSEFGRELSKYPIFIDTNRSRALMPVIMDYKINNTAILFMDGTDFIIWNEKLIFLANMTSEREIFWIVEGGNYTRQYDFLGLNINNKRVSTENLNVYYDDSLPEAAIFNEEVKFENCRYRINGAVFSPANDSFNDSGFAAIYVAGTENINHTSFVFAENREIDNFITTESSGSEYVLEISLDLENYDSYYSDNIYFGDFEYGTTENIVNYTYDYITLYSPYDSMSLFFDGPAEFNFTYYNTTLKAKISIPFSGDYAYRYVFQEGDYRSVSRQEYYARTGIEEPLEGIALEKIDTNYSHLKQKWKFPSAREFNIIVYENSSAYSYLQKSPLYEIGMFNPKNRNVFSETEDLLALDEEGTASHIHVLFRLW